MQGTQADELLAPVIGFAVPEEQIVQFTVPCVLEKVPLGHSKQSEAAVLPVNVLYFPAEQFM